MPAPGEVWRHAAFYADANTGAPLTKHLLVLAIRPDRDIVYRLLTSQQYHRTSSPACCHDGDRPGYYLGIPQPGGILWKETWLDLRELEEDYDALAFSKLAATGQLSHIHTFSSAELCPALLRAAYAQDTTSAQKRHIMKTRADLKCP